MSYADDLDMPVDDDELDLEDELDLDDEYADDEDD